MLTEFRVFWACRAGATLFGVHVFRVSGLRLARVRVYMILGGWNQGSLSSQAS